MNDNETSESSLKFCVNCRHCWARNPPRQDSKEYRCEHPHLYKLSIVSGLKEKSKDADFCYQVRDRDRADLCGFDAKWFEPIPKL